MGRGSMSCRSGAELWGAWAASGTWLGWTRSRGSDVHQLPRTDSTAEDNAVPVPITVLTPASAQVSAQCHLYPQNAAQERSRVRVLHGAFLLLQTALPIVPPSTKLSKLNVLVLAISYIAHLRHTLVQGTPPPALSCLPHRHPLLHPLQVRALPQAPVSPLHDGNTQSLWFPVTPCAHQHHPLCSLGPPKHNAPGPWGPHYVPCTLIAGPQCDPHTPAPTPQSSPSQVWVTRRRTRCCHPSPCPTPSLAEVANAPPSLHWPLGHPALPLWDSHSHQQP